MIYQKDPETLRAAMPVSVRRAVSRDGRRRNVVVYDSIYLLSDGSVISFAPDGDVNWRRSTIAAWTDPVVVENDADHHESAMADLAGDHTLELPAFPAVVPFQLRSTDAVDEEALLVVGAHNLVVLGQDGTRLMQLQLPDVLQGKVVIDDFSGDGIADLVLTTRSSIVAFSLAPQRAKPVFSFLLGVIVIGLAAYGVSSSSSVEPAGRGKRRRILRRSTDA